MILRFASRPSFRTAASFAVAALLALAHPVGVPAGPLGPEPPADEAATGAEAKAKADADAAAADTYSIDDRPTYSETVVVTASRTNQSLFELPVSTTVIGEERIKTSAADNIGDLLRGVPGLTVIQSNGRGVDLASRGGAGLVSHRNLALIDGRSIYLDYVGVTLWDTLPVAFDEISQIEVQSGAGSAVWGSNAVNGVINVRTKSPRELVGGQVQVGGGELGYQSIGARWAQAFDKMSYKISAGASEQDSFEREEEFPDGTPWPDFLKFKRRDPKHARIDMRIDHEDDGKLWSYRAGATSYEGIFVSTDGPYDVHPGAFIGYGEVVHERKLFEAKIYWNFLRSQAPNLFSTLPGGFNMDTYVADVVKRKLVGEHHFLVFGGTARLNEYNVDVVSDSSRTEAGFFLEDQMVPCDKLQVNLGVRLDWFDTIGWTASPRTSFIYQMTKNHSLRLAYQWAYRAPSAVENGFDGTIYSAFTPAPGEPLFPFAIHSVGNPDLDEEHAEVWELAWTAVLAKRTTMTLALYRNEVEDSIRFVPVEFYSSAKPPAGWTRDPAELDALFLPATFSTRNFGSVTDQGIEFFVNTDLPNHWNTTFSYTYQDKPDVECPGCVFPLNVNIPPRHQLAARVGYAGERVFGSLGVTFTDEATWLDPFDPAFYDTTNDFTYVDAAFGVNIKGGSQLVFKGTNVLDERERQHPFGDIIERRLWAEFRYRWGGDAAN